MNRRTVNLLTLVLLIILAFFLFLFNGSQDTINQAQAEAVELVSVDYPVDQVYNFYWLTTDETCFSMLFTDEAGIARYAIIHQDGGDVEYFEADEFITESQARLLIFEEIDPAEILNARLGLREGQPVWEITIINQSDLMDYYYVNARTGIWEWRIGDI